MVEILGRAITNNMETHIMVIETTKMETHIMVIEISQIVYSCFMPKQSTVKTISPRCWDQADELFPKAK